MKKRNLVALLFVFVSVLAAIGLAYFLFSGKSEEIKFETPSNGTSSVSIIKGEVMGAAYSIPGDVNADVSELAAYENEVKYITDNLKDKGYTNAEAFEFIKTYIESRGGKILSRTKEGLNFVMPDWILKRISKLSKRI